MVIAADDKTIVERVAQALAARNTQQAATLAEAALSGGLKHPVLFTARAVWSGEQGRHAEALADFKRADAYPPPNAATKSAIATSLTRLERYDEAIEAYDAAIALQPMAYQLHYRKGWALEMAGRLLEARQALQRAVEINPNYPEPFARLAALAARRGAWDEARSYADRALALDGDQIAAQRALAACEIEQGNLDAAEQRLQRILTSDKLGAIDRYLALSLLGDLRDKQDRFAEAFDYWSKAKQAAQQTLPGTSEQMSLLEATNGLCRYMEACPAIASRGTSAGGRPHIFLLGFLRTGTTLLEQVLASHEDVVSLEEKDTLGDAVQAYMNQPQDLDKLWTASENALAGFRDAYWRRVRGYGIDPSDKIVVDKVPINTIKIAVINRLFPDATILFAVRDPRDVVLSCFRHAFRLNGTTREMFTLENTARFYDAVMRLGELYRAKLPLKLHRMRLEDLVDDFDGQMLALCRASGLSWSDSMRDFAERSKARGITTPSATQVIRGLNRRGIGQWRRYREQLDPVMPLLAPWVEYFGYQPS
jgi:tetratricopeptide (TPR) repeat protein